MLILNEIADSLGMIKANSASYDDLQSSRHINHLSNISVSVLFFMVAFLSVLKLIRKS